MTGLELVVEKSKDEINEEIAEKLKKAKALRKERTFFGEFAGRIALYVTIGAALGIAACYVLHQFHNNFELAFENIYPF